MDPSEFVLAVGNARKRGSFLSVKSQEVNTCISSTPPEDLFESIDLDHDGFLTKEELRVCLALAGRTVREDVLELMIAMADKDGDGLVSRTEFSLFMADPAKAISQFALGENSSACLLPNRTSSNLKGGGGTVAKKNNPPTLQIISEAELIRMDAAERRKTCVQIVLALLGGIDEIRPKDIKQLYRRFLELDTKKVGKLNLLQFAKIFDRYPFAGARKIRSNYVNLLFTFCDSDKSNFLDAKEFMTGLCWLGSFGNLDKLRFTFMLFDANGDGEMDRGEILQFVTSVNIGDPAARSALSGRVDEIFKRIAAEQNVTDWANLCLSFEQLVKVADENPDLFTSIA